MYFILDTSIVSNLINDIVSPYLISQIESHRSDTLIVPYPVIFEVERGLHHKGATRQFSDFQTKVVPLFEKLDPAPQDWHLAAFLWAEARAAGRHLSDVDILLVAIAYQLNAILVTADNDFLFFDDLRLENWLLPSSA